MAPAFTPTHSESYNQEWIALRRRRVVVASGPSDPCKRNAGLDSFAEQFKRERPDAAATGQASLEAVLDLKSIFTSCWEQIKAPAIGHFTNTVALRDIFDVGVSVLFMTKK